MNESVMVAVGTAVTHWITEYILIGTLLSFTCAIAVAFGVLWLESLLFDS